MDGIWYGIVSQKKLDVWEYPGILNMVYEYIIYLAYSLKKMSWNIQIKNATCCGTSAKCLHKHSAYRLCSCFGTG